MRTRKPLKLESLPNWAIADETPSRYTIAAAFALAELTGEWVRLTAEAQRAVFGANLFGKKQIRVTDSGVDCVRSVSFGTDWSATSHSWDQIEKCVRKGYTMGF